MLTVTSTNQAIYSFSLFSDWGRVLLHTSATIWSQDHQTVFQRVTINSIRDFTPGQMFVGVKDQRSWLSSPGGGEDWGRVSRGGHHVGETGQVQHSEPEVGGGGLCCVLAGTNEVRDSGMVNDWDSLEDEYYVVGSRPGSLLSSGNL